jgi:hypothetical protein
LLVVVAELEVVFEPVEEPVAVVRVVALVAALVDVDEELLVDVSIRIPPVEVEELVLVFEAMLVEALELLLSPELELPLPPSDLMLCQLPLSSV